MSQDFKTLIETRRATRKYTSQSVTQGQIETVLTAATHAPSAHNRQPWRFAVLTAPDDKARLAQAMGQRLSQDRLADGDSPGAVARDVTRSYRRITNPPALIVVCLSMADMDAYPDDNRSRNEWVMAVQSVSMAAQTMWLAAHNLGLAMGWLCAPLFAPDVVRQTLGLPADWDPLGLMPLGYSDETPSRGRESLETKVLWV